MAFQHYFVRDRCEPVVTGFEFEGAEHAQPCGAVLDALADDSLRCVVVCPSNPFISIDPILAVPGMRAAIRAAGAPVIGVSPIIGGRAVKGPTAKMMRELGLDPVDGGSRTAPWSATTGTSWTHGSSTVRTRRMQPGSTVRYGSLRR